MVNEIENTKIEQVQDTFGNAVNVLKNLKLTPPDEFVYTDPDIDPHIGKTVIDETKFPNLKHAFNEIDNNA